MVNFIKTDEQTIINLAHIATVTIVGKVITYQFMDDQEEHQDFNSEDEAKEFFKKLTSNVAISW